MSGGQVWRRFFPSAEAKVVEAAIRRAAHPLALPAHVVGAAVRVAREDPEVADGVRRGDAPLATALLLLHEVVEAELLTGSGSSYRGRLSPAGQQLWSAWTSLAEQLVAQGALTAEQRDQAATDLRDAMKGVG